VDPAGVSNGPKHGRFSGPVLADEKDDRRVEFDLSGLLKILELERVAVSAGKQL
jgi:hypothetical protein